MDVCIVYHLPFINFIITNTNGTLATWMYNNGGISLNVCLCINARCIRVVEERGTEAWSYLLEMTVGTQVNIDISWGTNSGIQQGFKPKTFWRCLATNDIITLWNYTEFSFFLPKVLKCIIDSQATIFACMGACALYNTYIAALWIFNIIVWFRICEITPVPRLKLLITSCVLTPYRCAKVDG